MSEKTLEQEARDLLEECGVEDAQQFTAGDLVSIANKLDEFYALQDRIAELEAREKQLRALAEFGHACLPNQENGGLTRAGRFEMAQDLGLMKYHGGGTLPSYTLTELAQLPEE